MSDDEIEIPRRKRYWGRWFLFLLAVGVVVMLVLPPMMSNRADKLILERVARYRAAGEPASAADLATAPLPDEENAVVELRQAAGIVTAYSSNDAWKTYQESDRGYPLTGKEKALVRTIVEDNAEVFPLMDAAMAKEGFYWPNQPTKPLVSWLLPDLSPQRGLANFLATAATADHDRMDDAATVKELHRLIFVGRGIEHHPQCLVVELVAIGIRALACEQVYKIGPDLKIGDSAGAASPKQIAELIGELLDEREANATFHRSLLTERVCELDLSEEIFHGRGNILASIGANTGAVPVLASPAGRYLTGPWIRADLIMMLDAVTKTAQATQRPDWPTARHEVAHLEDVMAASPIRHGFARIMMPSLDRAVETNYRGRAGQRMAAIVLAIRWYAAEHQGQLPPTLDALVPKYLPAVPEDPFMAGGETALRYVPAEPDPRIYSVGHNEVDDGGSDLPGRDMPKSKTVHGRWDELDAVVHLRRQQRNTKDLPDGLRD